MRESASEMDAGSAKQKAGRREAQFWQSSFKYHESRVILMCEALERRIIARDLPYDLEEPGDEREITRGLMRLSQQALSKYVDKEPDIY